MILKMKSVLHNIRDNWKIRSGIVLIVAMAWLSILFGADSFFTPYLLVAMLGLMACVRDTDSEAVPRRERLYRILFAAFFSLTVVLANYKLISPVRDHVPEGLVLLGGGLLIGWLVLKLSLEMEIRSCHPTPAGKKAAGCFWLLFLLFSLVYLSALLFCYRPGILSPDSVSQIWQNVNKIYSNHHPYWHTMIIKVCMDLGMSVFHDINQAVMVYSVFQAIGMSAIFAFLGMTVYEAGAPGIIMAMTAAFYAFLPYHILYSITMWKDILFAGSVALFICAMYRILKGIDSKIVNTITLTAGGLGCCLLRSNGMAAFVFTFLVFLIFLWKEKKKVLFLLLFVIAASYVLKHPVLEKRGVIQPDTVEFLSIPVQQVARVIVEGEELEEDERELIGQIMEIEAVKEKYAAYISDPIKNLIRDTNPDYLDAHKQEYLMLWIRLGLKHPVLYVKAWIDQTRGFWNGGYMNYVVKPIVEENEYGIYMTDQKNIVARAMTKWVYVFFNHPAFEVFRSIGLHVWGLILCVIVLLIRKRKEALLFVLPIAIILTLFISTPVYAEFRYSYAIFTPIPLLLYAAFEEHRVPS